MASHDIVASNALARARRAAEAAGRLLQDRFGHAEVNARTGRDIKLLEDRLAQDLIVESLRERGDEPVLTEENGWIGQPPAQGQAYWVVDPLDGSYNYSCGIPLCCVAVALCRDETPLAGCVHDFIRGETFEAATSGPLRLNGRGLGPVHRPAAVLATGFPVAGEHSADAIGHHLGQWRKLRMLGSAALSLAWVAAGRLDAYSEDGIRWWDVAAGMALVEGSGGRVSRVAEGTDPMTRLAGPWRIEAVRAGVSLPQGVRA